MKLAVNRDVLLKPLQQVAGVVERRQTLPVLSNVLLEVDGDRLSMTGTDLEVEMIAHISVSSGTDGVITVPARKMLDICRELPDGAEVEMEVKEQRLEIRSGRFRSTLSTLPAADFPTIDKGDPEVSVSVPANSLKSVIDQTGFAMAQQDVRYFLNGMLLEIGDGHVRSVATDGHRLATSFFDHEAASESARQVIVPRKGILELQRLLNELDGDVEIALGSNHLCANTDLFSMTSKLVDGRFPDYERVIPKNGDKVISADRTDLKQAMNRTAILSNEKFRGIRVGFTSGTIQLSANNPEQEEAEEAVAVEYEGTDLEIGFNVSYLQDVLNVLSGDSVKITVHDANSSALIEDPENENSLYVVMPMKL